MYTCLYTICTYHVNIYIYIIYIYKIQRLSVGDVGFHVDLPFFWFLTVQLMEFVIHVEKFCDKPGS